MVLKWQMSGSVVGACNCDWGCPCSFDARPTRGGCNGVYVWVVDEGRYGDTKLDGLAFVGAGSHPGPIHLGHGTAVTIVDERATAAQRRAIETVRKGGGVGPPFDIFAKTTETWLPTVYAPFDVRLNGIRSTVRVDGGKIYDLAISRIRNPVSGAEEELYLEKPTGFTAKRSEIGMSLVARLNVPGMAYDNSGQYAEFSQFSYAGRELD